MKIYLAGKMGGLTYEEMNGWREDAIKKISFMTEYYGYDTKLHIINPVIYYNFEEVRYQSQIEVEDFDLKHVTSSDLVIVNLDGLDSSIGTIIELHDAYYHNKIPVIAFGDKKIYDNLHPWVKNSITRVENDINDVVLYIKDFYLTR